MPGESVRKEDIHQIEGNISRVLFRNEINGYVIVELDCEGEIVTATGELGDIEEGERLSLFGEFVSHPRFGPQFRAESCERKLPNTAESIQRYLASGVIKGIGEALAEKIVDVFGARTLEVMEREPDAPARSARHEPEKMRGDRCRSEAYFRPARGHLLF